MKELVVIELHRNEPVGDFHDLFVDEIERNKYLKTIKQYGNKINKKIVFDVASSNMQLADYDNYATIKYTGSLSEEEKKYYIDFIKIFMRNWKYGRAVREVLMPFTVIFEPIPNATFLDIR